MATANIIYEKFAAALEATRGTLVTPPDHHLGFTGELSPVQDWKALDQNYGVQADETADPLLLRATATWTGKGDLVMERIPWWMSTAVKGGVTAPLTDNKVVSSTSTLVGGTGYTPTSGTFVLGVSGGSPKTPARIVATVAGGIVTGLTVVNPGLGYSAAPTLDFTPGGGTGASATAVITTPTLAKLWQWDKTETADDIAAFTGYWGDPNVQIYQSVFSVTTDFNIKADASGTNLVQADAKGFGQFLNAIGAPAFPAVAGATGLIPTATQLWIDPPSGNWGDTEVTTTNSLVSADAAIATGAEMVITAQGPAGNKSYNRITRKKITACKLSIVNTFDDVTLYNYAEAANSVRMKIRVRYNGPVIETISGVPFYYFVQIDLLAKLRTSGWGSTATTQRTLKIDANSSYRIVDATSLTVYAQLPLSSV